MNGTASDETRTGWADQRDAWQRYGLA